VTHRRLPSARHVPFPPTLSRTMNGCFLGRSIRSAELSPLTSYFQSPTPSSYHQPTRSLLPSGTRAICSIPRGTSSVSKTEDVREKHLLPRFGASLVRSVSEENTIGYMFQREEYASDQRYILCIMLTLRARARE